MRALATGQLTEDDFLSEAERMAKYGAYGAYTAPRREQQPMNGQYNPYTPPMADDFRSYEQCGYGGTQQGTNYRSSPRHRCPHCRWAAAHPTAAGATEAACGTAGVEIKLRLRSLPMARTNKYNCIKQKSTHRVLFFDRVA